MCTASSKTAAQRGRCRSCAATSVGPIDSIIVVLRALETVHEREHTLSRDRRGRASWRERRSAAYSGEAVPDETSASRYLAVTSVTPSGLRSALSTARCLRDSLACATRPAPRPDAPAAAAEGREPLGRGVGDLAGVVGCPDAGAVMQLRPLLMKTLRPSCRDTVPSVRLIVAVRIFEKRPWAWTRGLPR